MRGTAAVGVLGVGVCLGVVCVQEPFLLQYIHVILLFLLG